MAKDSMYPGMDEDEDMHEDMDHEMDDKKGMDKEKDGETALLPKSFFEGQELKPGQQYYVEIVRAYEDEVEVKYPHEVKEEKEEEPSANDKIAAMGTEMGGNPGSGGY